MRGVLSAVWTGESPDELTETIWPTNRLQSLPKTEAKDIPNEWWNRFAEISGLVEKRPTEPTLDQQETSETEALPIVEPAKIIEPIEKSKRIPGKIPNQFPEFGTLETAIVALALAAALGYAIWP
jgi:predicted alternative tryptophan synthase beta-subunit